MTQQQTQWTDQRAAWDRACLAWSRDDGKDPERTGELGERMLYAATDLICALETEIEALRNRGGELVVALNRYGFPVSNGAKVNLTSFGSSEAMAVDLTTREFEAALNTEGK